MIEFVEYGKVFDLHRVFLCVKDSCVGSIIVADEGWIVGSIDCDELAGNDYIAIGKKLNELNGVSDE